MTRAGHGPRDLRCRVQRHRRRGKRVERQPLARACEAAPVKCWHLWRHSCDIRVDFMAAGAFAETDHAAGLLGSAERLGEPYRRSAASGHGHCPCRFGAVFDMTTTRPRITASGSVKSAASVGRAWRPAASRCRFHQGRPSRLPAQRACEAAGPRRAPFESVFDYSYDAVMRSYEASRIRLRRARRAIGPRRVRRVHGAAARIGALTSFATARGSERAIGLGAERGSCASRWLMATTTSCCSPEEGTLTSDIKAGVCRTSCPRATIEAVCASRRAAGGRGIAVSGWRIRR